MESKVFNPDNYWEDRLGKIKGLEGVGFKKLGPSFNKWAYRVRRKVFIKQVPTLKTDISKANVLDIGSGTGFYIQIWRDLNAGEITGLDITPTSVKDLQQKFPGNSFILSDIGDAKFDKDIKGVQYDLISCMDVLFHIVDDQRFEKSIQNISSVLKPGGYFIYSDLYLDHIDTMRGESQVCRTKKYLLSLFSENGFELVTFTPFMYLTNKPIDTKNPIIKAYWFLLENTLYAFPFLGYIFGPLLYPFELLFVNSGHESPTTEFTIFRKKQ